MKTAAVGLLLVLLVFLVVLSSVVEVSLEYGEGRLNLGVSALWGLVRRCLAMGRKEEGAGEQVKEAGLLRPVLVEGWRFHGTGLYLLKKTRLEKLDVDLSVGLGRADLTARSVGSLWAVTGFMAAALSHMVAPGSARPRLRVTPCFGKQHFALAVRGRVKVRICYLVAAGWRAWRTGRNTKGSGLSLHKFSVPGNIKPCRKPPATNKTR